ncbi:MAG: M48 family metalloprotease [Clostridia bacterium]|nr:M48 family metalloprotease [Clostridia bacterium]
MYLFSYFKNLFRKANIPVIIWMVLNLFIIAITMYLLIGMDGAPANFGLCMLWGVLLYFFSLAVALSPAGEFILRIKEGARKIKRQEQIDYLMPLFDEVKAKAIAADPSIPQDVKLYISPEAGPNAFALGRKTICVTKGLLELPPDEIKAILGHEFGHIAHHDTDNILMVSVGNLVVNVILVGVRLAVEIIRVLTDFAALVLPGRTFVLGVMLNHLYHILVFLLIDLFTWVWTKLGVLLVMKSSRDCEYEADKFSYDLGYGDRLCHALDLIDNGQSRPEGLFAALSSSHPATDDRIAKMQAYGATYRATYGQGYSTLNTNSTSQQTTNSTSSSGAPGAVPRSNQVPPNRPSANQATAQNPQQTNAAPARNFCPYCGSPLNQSAKFCPGCGKPLKKPN